MMDLPKYFLLSGRPIKLVRTEEGGVGAYGFNFQTGDFDLNMRYFVRVTKADDEDVEAVSEEEFLATVEELRKEIAAKKYG